MIIIIIIIGHLQKPTDLHEIFLTLCWKFSQYRSEKFLVGIYNLGRRFKLKSFGLKFLHGNRYYIHFIAILLSSVFSMFRKKLCTSRIDRLWTFLKKLSPLHSFWIAINVKLNLKFSPVVALNSWLNKNWTNNRPWQ